MLRKPNASQSYLDKYKIQDDQYSFPYHHIPHFDKKGVGVRFRALSWGFEYLCYSRHVCELVHTLTPSSVLEVGCGDGRVIGMLDWGIDRRVGVDLSKRAIRFAKAFYHEIEFLSVDARELKETFDVVLTVSVLEHISDDQVSTFLKTLEERTNRGGYVVISIPTTVARVSKKHYRHYDLNLLQKQLEEADVHLDIVNVEYVYRNSLLVKLYSKVAKNHHWFIEFRVFNYLIWNYVWKRLRKADEKHGKHLVVVLGKK
ncbi:MAG: class I SAM-dependent methyltransferase [Phycisphaerae bacterium]|nr:class I SAM-dependent methyltransferase [Phycisphaerae bacterium]MDD5381826.1 class I SAM-dependent methyltransferase [Phycisphaerae bacterium]